MHFVLSAHLFFCVPYLRLLLAFGSFSFEWVLLLLVCRILRCDAASPGYRRYSQISHFYAKNSPRLPLFCSAKFPILHFYARTSVFAIKFPFPTFPAILRSVEFPTFAADFPFSQSSYRGAQRRRFFSRVVFSITALFGPRFRGCKCASAISIIVLMAS